MFININSAKTPVTCDKRAIAHNLSHADTKQSIKTAKTRYEQWLARNTGKTVLITLDLTDDTQLTPDNFFQSVSE